MRRGYTLLELVVAISILTVIFSITLRLVFFSDRALGGVEEKAADTAVAARLLQDVSRDARSASEVTVGPGYLRMTSPAGAVIYRWSASTGATSRRGSHGASDQREYPGASCSASVSARFVEFIVKTRYTRLTSGVSLRN